jgi:hypothetical protein
VRYEFMPMLCFFLSLAKREVLFIRTAKRWPKTYNSGDSLVVTHLTTNPPVSCLYMAERTGSLILKILWSYVKEKHFNAVYVDGQQQRRQATAKKLSMICACISLSSMYGSET